MRPHRLLKCSDSRSEPRGETQRARGGTAALLALLMIALLLTLSGCGMATSTLSPSARATQTAAAAATQTAAAARATQTAQPVTVAVSAKQQGLLSQRDSVLRITILITNHTQAPINIAGGCSEPPYTLRFLDTAGKVAYYYGPGSVIGCPIDSPLRDGPLPISPGATAPGPLTPIVQSFWNQAAGDGGPLIQPGTYTLVVTVNLWHQGTIGQYENDTSGTYAHGSATAQTMVTLR